MRAPGSKIDYSLSAVYTGLPSHSKVEVTHRVGDPVGSGEAFQIIVPVALILVMDSCVC